MKNESLGLTLNNSIVPIIQELERYYNFLNKKFACELPPQVIITLAKAHEKTKGFFFAKKFDNTKQKLNQINLNTLRLKKDNPYEVFTHEFVHYFNYYNNISDCAKNGRHNKNFKREAERFLLEVNKEVLDFRGYAYTKETEAFNKMLEEEFKPNKKVWNIEELDFKKKNTKKGLRKYKCSCDIIIRASTDELQANCNECETKFQLEEN